MPAANATVSDRNAGEGRSTPKEPSADQKDLRLAGKDPSADGREPRVGLSSAERRWKRATFRKS